MDAFATPALRTRSTIAAPGGPARAAASSDSLQRAVAGPVLDAIFQLRMDAWAADGVMLTGAGGRYVDALDDDPRAETYGYLADGQPVGTIRVSVHDSNASMLFPDELRATFPESPLGYISRLAVHRDWRRRGLGYTLIDFSLQRLRELGVKGIQAFTPVGHVTKYMESHGFTVYRTAMIKSGQQRLLAAAFYLAL